MIEDLIVYIKLHDTAPSAFDISMKPTLFRVFQGYLSTAFVAVARRFALEENKTV
jgi:hypothetical protein